MKKRGKEEQGLRRDHQGGEKSPEAIHDLPFDLTIEILSRLPVKILARLRCVSKLWSSSIITESIKTRSLSQPCQLVIFHNSSYISSCTYPVNTTTRFVAADRGSCSLLQRSYYRIYGYVGGLICHSENYKQFAIYNPTTRHNVLLPIVLYHKKNKASDGFSRYDSVKNEYTILRNYLHGFFGYDPVENQYKVLWFVEGATLFDYSCQVITFEGGPNKQKWRKIEIQDDISPPKSNGVCINGIIYYLGGNLTSSSVLVLGRFDVRFERFDHIQMPIDVEMNQLEELNLVNYQGKLGCTFYSKDRAEVWIMKYHHLSENEWSKITIDMSTPYLLKTRIAGVTLKGEIVIMPVTLGPAQTLLYAYFYDPKEKKTRRAEFETNLKGEPGDCILSEPNHMENTISLFGSQFNKKPAKPPSLLKKNPLTTTVFSDKKSFSHKKSFPCPKKLLVVAFSCAVLVLATTFRTWLIPLLDSLHR